MLRPIKNKKNICCWLFSYFEFPCAQFWNPTKSPSGRKVTAGEEEEKKPLLIHLVP
jgi:hypothetical protein